MVKDTPSLNDEEKAYDHVEYIFTNPDDKIISWTNMEYTLFRALEYARYGDIITKGFRSVDEFVRVANVVLNVEKVGRVKALNIIYQQYLTGMA